MEERDPMLRLASLLLPEQEVSGVAAIYAWCRRADEICDAPEPPRTAEERLGLLDALEADLRVMCSGGAPQSDVDAALRRAMEEWPSLEQRPFLDMLEGMRTELRQPRFQSFEPELRRYAYCVAGTVGLMVLPLLGAARASKAARDRAVGLGVGVQLVNILRDVGYDAGLGRVYLPLEDLARFGVDEADVLARRMTPAYRELVAFQVARARTFLDGAREALPELPRRSQLVVLAVVRLMHGLLDELVDGRGCDNLSGKVRLGTLQKVSCFAGAAWEWLWLPWW